MAGVVGNVSMLKQTEGENQTPFHGMDLQCAKVLRDGGRRGRTKGGWVHATRTQKLNTQI